MGAFDAFRNLAIFMIVINLAAVMAGAMFPSLRTAVLDSVGMVNELQQQANSITPQNTGTVGDLVATFGFMKFFFGNILAGNYYVWKMLGLDQPIVLEPGGETSTWTFALALSIFVELIYAIALIEFVRGRI